MRTITFYSYKGGTGRTLLLANVAKFLAWCGKTVAVLDLDLEAPGLHYKLGMRNSATDGGPLEVRRGLIDYLLAWQDADDDPGEDLSTYFVKDISLDSSYSGKVHLLPAGDAPSVAYAERLVRLDWWQLLYRDHDAPLAQRLGARALARLKEFAYADLRADFLLIDSRTGITDIGGIALNVLPDCVVCTMLSNQENIDGIRQVVRNLEYRNASREASLVEYLVLLTRYQESTRLHADREQATIATIEGQLFSALADHEGGVKGRLGLAVLHTDRDLELNEALRFDGAYTPNESLLIRDYFRVFRTLGLLDHVPSSHVHLVERIARRPHSQAMIVAERIARGHVVDWPEDPWRSSTGNRVELRQPNALVYLPPTSLEPWKRAVRFWRFDTFLNSVAKQIGTDIHGEVRSKEPPPFAWDYLVASRILEGELDFSGEPFFLTWVRSHLVGIVQFGWIWNFTLMVIETSSPSPLVEALQQILQEIDGHAENHADERQRESAIVRVARSLLERHVEFEVGVVLESAASVECMRHLPVLLKPSALHRLGSERELRDWMVKNSGVALAVCDYILADTVAVPAREIGSKTDSSDGYRFKYGRTDPLYLLPSSHPTPVGIPYAAGDPGWRRIIAKAFLTVLSNRPDDWGNSKSKSTVFRELRQAGIHPMDVDELRDSLMLDLRLGDAVRYDVAAEA